MIYYNQNLKEDDLSNDSDASRIRELTVVDVIIIFHWKLSSRHFKFLIYYQLIRHNYLRNAK